MINSANPLLNFEKAYSVPLWMCWSVAARETFLTAVLQSTELATHAQFVFGPTILTLRLNLFYTVDK